jgi:hypothetical protein
MMTTEWLEIDAAPPHNERTKTAPLTTAKAIVSVHHFP